MKRGWMILGVVALVAAIGGGVFWWSTQPRTPAEAFTLADTRQVRIDEALTVERRAPSPDVERVAALEVERFGLWSSFLVKWPAGTEADEARYRLLEFEIETADSAETRLDLIDAFIDEGPDGDRRLRLPEPVAIEQGGFQVEQPRNDGRGHQDGGESDGEAAQSRRCSNLRAFLRCVLLGSSRA